ncbi:MAG TPA: aminoglycoside phosphotransferase family protein [Phenylobacterium sp.]
MALARDGLQADPLDARRFPTGLIHFVYEVALRDRPTVVVRISRQENREICRSAARLSALLRGRAAPLPSLLFDGSEGEWPFLILERLPGQDLGKVIAGLTTLQRRRIADRVASAQAIAMGLPSSGRYGFAASADAAPFRRWSEVLSAHLARSRSRLAGRDLFGPSIFDACHELLLKLTHKADRVEATPFLHDTTTKNVIVTDAGDFSGIVDVDDLCYGDPRYAMALTTASLLASEPGALDYVRAWMASAGAADDDLFRLYVVLFLVDFMSEHALAFNGNRAASSKDARAALEQVFRRALQDVV